MKLKNSGYIFGLPTSAFFVLIITVFVNNYLTSAALERKNFIRASQNAHPHEESDTARHHLADQIIPIFFSKDSHRLQINEDDKITNEDDKVKIFPFKLLLSPTPEPLTTYSNEEITGLIEDILFSGLKKIKGYELLQKVSFNAACNIKYVIDTTAGQSDNTRNLISSKTPRTLIELPEGLATFDFSTDQSSYPSAFLNNDLETVMENDFLEVVNKIPEWEGVTNVEYSRNDSFDYDDDSNEVNTVTDDDSEVEVTDDGSRVVVTGGVETQTGVSVSSGSNTSTILMGVFATLGALLFLTWGTVTIKRKKDEMRVSDKREEVETIVQNTSVDGHDDCNLSISFSEEGLSNSIEMRHVY